MNHTNAGTSRLRRGAAVFSQEPEKKNSAGFDFFFYLKGKKQIFLRFLIAVAPGQKKGENKRNKMDNF
jgi:hypothetical protein